MIRVIIADDHAVVRAGVRQILSDVPDIIVAEEANNGHDAIEKVRKTGCDVLLLDISLPVMSGLEVLKEIKKEMPRLPVLLLTMYPEEQYAIRAVRAGAAGYLTKGSVADELVKAIRKVYSRGKYITASLAERLANKIASNDETLLHERLSDREYQVMLMIAGGKTATEIAGELSLSVKTISTYRSRILEKMNFKNNAEITHYAIKNNLLD